MLPGVESSEGLTGSGGSASKVAQAYAWEDSAACWQEVWIPYHLDLPMRLACPLMTWQLASPIVSDPRESKAETAMSFMMSHCYFYNIQCVARFSPGHCSQG